MTKIKYNIVFKRIDKRTGHIISSNCRDVVEAESETNAIAKVKTLHTCGGQEICEVVSVTPKK